MLIMILAHDETNVMGYQGRLPWHNPQDLAFFHQTIDQKSIIVGKNTYLGLPKIINALKIYVVTSSSVKIVHPQAEIIRDLNKSIETWKSTKDTYFVCGGAQIYSLLYQDCSEIYVTTINGTYRGDVYFNPHWIKHMHLFETIKDETFTINKYRK